MAAVGVVVVPGDSVLVGSWKGGKGEWGRTSSRVFSAIILWNPIPTPSITANKHAHPIAEFRAAFAPPLIASAPPVKKPAMTVPFYQHSITCLGLPNIAVTGIGVQHTGIIWVLLLPYSLHRTIEGRE